MRGTITDTGPLYALINHKDSNHVRAKLGLEAIDLPMLTTWPCLTEALHLVGDRLGRRGQRALADLVSRLDVVVIDSVHHSVREVFELMEEYSDAPMDCADASLVVAAASLQKHRIFTFDRHFHAYRYRKNQHFQIVS